MAAERVVEVHIRKAEGLKDVKLLGFLKTYAVVDVDHYVHYTTKVDETNGVNPVWDETFGFMLPESAFQQEGASSNMKVEIYTVAALGRPKLVGEVNIPLVDILRYKLKKYPIRTASGEFQGELEMSFSVGEKDLLSGNAQRGAPTRELRTPVTPNAQSYTYDEKDIKPFASHISPQQNPVPMTPLTQPWYPPNPTSLSPTTTLKPPAAPAEPRAQTYPYSSETLSPTSPPYSTLSSPAPRQSSSLTSSKGGLFASALGKVLLSEI